MSQGDHLLRRNGVYYYRRRVPESVVEKIGKREVTQSLGTSNLSKAKRLRNLLDAKFDHLFSVRSVIERPAALGVDHRGSLDLAQLDQYLKALSSRARADFFTSPPASNDERRDMEESVGRMIDILQDRDDPRSDEYISRVVRAISNVADVEEGVAEAIRRGLLLVEREKLARIAAARWRRHEHRNSNGRWCGTSKPSFNPAYAPLILSPVDMERRVLNGEYIFSISGRDEDEVVNAALNEKLKRHQS